jgi:hypothetical protein
MKATRHRAAFEESLGKAAGSETVGAHHGYRLGNAPDMLKPSEANSIAKHNLPGRQFGGFGSGTQADRRDPAEEP